MLNTIKDTLTVCERVTNDRTPVSIFAHGELEINELRLELLNSIVGKPQGEDGIIGEACDVIACMIDLIYKSYPGITDKDIHDTLMAKLDKWERDYSK